MPVVQYVWHLAGRRRLSRDTAFDELADRLRREAARNRPEFSDNLHGRILKALRAEPQAARLAAAAGPASAVVRRLGASRIWLAVIVIVGSRPEQANDLRSSVAVTPSTPIIDDSVVATTPDELPLGIDRMPMFDDLQAEVQVGMLSLASSLLDVPEWRSAVGLDAADLLEGEAGR